MEFLSSDQVTGHKMALKTTDPRHIQGAGTSSGRLEKKDPTFDNMMFEALNGVNKVQQESNNLNVQMITDPDSVDAHDITIAMAKANTALAITKAVIDRGIRAYKEILSIR